MNNEYTFETFYTEKLQPLIAAIDPAGNDAVKWLTAGTASFVLGFGCVIIREYAAVLVFLALLIISVVKYTGKKDTFTTGFKEKIIKEIIAYVNPGAIYNPGQVISPGDYDKSGLFTIRHTDYTGQDMIQGVYKNVTYYCSEVNTEHTTNSRNPSTIPVFDGLFFAAPVSSAYTGCTYVWPVNDEQLPHSLADEYFDRRMLLPVVNRIATGNNEFEQKFVVYSTNPGEALSLLTDTRIKRIMAFEKQIERPVRCSFINGVCYVAIEMEQSLFEPNILSREHKEEMKEYFFGFLLILSIINQLGLAELI